MSNGITGLRGYQQGGSPEDPPSFWERRRLRGQESTLPRLDMNLPLAFRQIVGDVIGKQVRERLGMEGLGNLIGSKDITAGDLSHAELNALQDAVLRGMGGTLQDRGVLEYEDYATSGDDPHADVGGSEGSGIIRKFFDPSFSVKTTFGQGAIEKDPDTGDYYMTDQYNFNERLPDPTEFGDFLEILKRRSAEQGAYGVPRAFGEAYGSPEGEGSLVRINLGNLEKALARSRREEQPSRLARGLGWLRGIFDRDDDVQVAERVAQPVDELRDIQPVREPRLYDVSPTDPLLR